MQFEDVLRLAYAGAFPESVTAPSRGEVLDAATVSSFGPPTTDEPAFTNVHLVDVLRRIAGGAHAAMADRVYVRGAFELARNSKIPKNLRNALSDLEADWCAGISPELERKWRITPASWDTPEMRAKWPSAPRPTLVMQVQVNGPDSAVRNFSEIVSTAVRTSAEWAYEFRLRDMLVRDAYVGDDLISLRHFVSCTLQTYIDGLECKTNGVEAHSLRTWRKFAPSFEKAPPNAAAGPLLTADEYAGRADADAARAEINDALVAYPYPRSRTRWRESFGMSPAAGAADPGDAITMAVFLREVSAPITREQILMRTADVLKDVPEFKEFTAWEDASAVRDVSDAAAHAAVRRVLQAEPEMMQAMDEVVRFANTTTLFQRWLAAFDDGRFEVVLSGLTDSALRVLRDRTDPDSEDKRRAVANWRFKAQYPEVVAALKMVYTGGSVAADAWPSEVDMQTALLDAAVTPAQLLRKLASTVVVYCGPVTAPATAWARYTVRDYSRFGDVGPKRVAALIRLGENSTKREDRLMLASVRNPREYMAYLMRGMESSLSTEAVRQRSLDVAQDRALPTEFGKSRRDMESFMRALTDVAANEWYEFCRLANEPSANNAVDCQVAAQAHDRFETIFKTQWTADVQIVRETSFLAQRGTWLIELRREEDVARVVQARAERAETLRHMHVKLQDWFARTRFDDTPLTPQLPRGSYVLGFERFAGNSRKQGGTELMTFAWDHQERVWPIMILGVGENARPDAAQAQVYRQVIQRGYDDVARELRELDGCFALKARLARVRFGAGDVNPLFRPVSKLAELLFGAVVAPDTDLFRSLSDQNAYLMDASTGDVTSNPAKIGELAGSLKELGVALRPADLPSTKKTDPKFGLAAARFVKRLREKDLVAPAPKPEVVPTDPVPAQRPPAALVLRANSALVEVDYADASQIEFVCDVPPGMVPHDWCVAANQFVADTMLPVGTLLEKDMARPRIATYMQSVEEMSRAAPLPPPFDPKPYTIKSAYEQQEEEEEESKPKAAKERKRRKKNVTT